MNFKRRVLIGLIVCASFSAQATSSSPTKIVKAVQQTRQSLVEKEERQRKILSRLYIINKRLKKIVTKKSGLEQDLVGLEANTKELANKINDLDTKVKKQRSLLMARLTAIYKFGGQGVARFLFSSQSSAALERNLKILGVIAARDIEVIRDYGASVKELESKRSRLEKRLAKLRRTEEGIKIAEADLKSETDSKSKILDGLKRSRQFELSKLQQLRSQSEKLDIQDDGLLDLLAGPAFFEQKGKLPYPAKGPIEQGFGLVHENQYNTVLNHKGIFIRAKEGQPVESVFAGRVAYTGELGEYGHVVIIDHGDHYYSVYGNAKEVTVTVGQEVKQAQSVATVGKTSLDYGEGLYFEIRHFSEPYDPKAWMKGKPL